MKPYEVSRNDLPHSKFFRMSNIRGKNPNDGSKNYKLFIQSAPEQGSVSDPARQIGGTNPSSDR